MATKKEQPKLSLAGKIAAIRAEVGTIEKTGHNKFHGYKYAEETGVLNAVNPLLEQHKITIIPSVLEKKNTPMDKGFFVEVRMRFTIYDLESSDKLEIEWCGDGTDSQDKGLYKAYAGCTKYFYLKLFGIGTAEDPENDSAEHKEVQRAERQKGRQIKTTSPEGHEMACPQCGEPCAYSHTDKEFGEVFECANAKCSKKGQRYKWVTEAK